MASGHSSYTTSLPVPAVPPENLQWTMPDCISFGEERDKQDILPARDFILRKSCCGEGAGLQPEVLGSEEQSVLL